jgi:hypothetical protein
MSVILLDTIFNYRVRLTYERLNHIESSHPEMSKELEKIKTTLINPDIIVKSKIDDSVILFYKKFALTVVGDKFICVVVKNLNRDIFIITAYFTDTIKKGEVLWQKK